MDYAAHAAAAPPATDPHPAYSYPYGYPYTYPAYHQPDPAAAADPSAASSSYYCPNPTAPADAQAQHNPYANTYHYYDPSAVPYGGGGLADYYYGAGQASQAPAASAAQAAPAAAGKHFGFDPRRYAQVAAAKAPNGMAPEADATVMHHGQWNAHSGHPLPSNAPRKLIKKAPRVVQTVTCEVCKIQCGTTLDSLRQHETGKKHKRILRKLRAKNRPMPNLVKKIPAQPATCEVCKRQLNSLTSLRSHETGKKQKPVTCEVCKVQCYGLNSLRAHETCKKHKKNLEKLQGSITPEPAKPPNDAVGASTEPAAAAVADGVIPAVQPKKNKRHTAGLEDLEVKRRRVLEAESAEGEVKNCTMSNVMKKIPEDVQPPVTCEVCKMQFNGLNGFRAQEKGQKNLEKLQDSITPKQENPPNGVVGARTTPAAADVANGVIPAVRPKKNKRHAVTCEVCKVRCGFTIDCLRIHETGKKHKMNLEKLQGCQDYGLHLHIAGSKHKGSRADRAGSLQSTRAVGFATPLQESSSSV